MSIPVLYHLGDLQFRTLPFSVGDVAASRAADWAPKDVIGTMRPREYVGPGDERLSLSGVLFPLALAAGSEGHSDGGGLRHLDRLEAMQRAGVPFPLVRGDGRHMGWFVIESVTRGDSRLTAVGIGRQVDYGIQLVRMPKPSPADYVRSLLRLFA